LRLHNVPQNLSAVSGTTRAVVADAAVVAAMCALLSTSDQSRMYHQRYILKLPISAVVAIETLTRSAVSVQRSARVLMQCRNATSFWNE